MTAAVEHLVRIGDVEFACTDTGGSGRPLLLVHGFTGSRDDWADIVEPLSDRTGRVIACDLRGHGGSTNVGRRSAYEFPVLVADLLGWLDALGVESCDAIGHSLGGLVLVRAAAQHPERFNSLVLMSTPARPTVKNMSGLLDGGSLVERLGAMRFLVNLGFTNTLARVGGMRMLTPFFVRSARVGPPSMRASREAMGAEVFDERVRVKVRAMDAQAFVHIGEYLTRFPSMVDDLRTLTCPTMVMVGEEDTEFLLLAQEVLDALLDGESDATFVVVPSAAHSPQFENTKAWLEIVATHIESARSATASGRDD